MSATLAACLANPLPQLDDYGLVSDVTEDDEVVVTDTDDDDEPVDILGGLGAIVHGVMGFLGEAVKGAQKVTEDQVK